MINFRQLKMLLIAVAVLLSSTSCALIFLSPTVQSVMAGKAPIMTAVQAEGQKDVLRGQVIQLYGRITKNGRRPCLDGLVTLSPNTDDTFANLKIGELILVRGFLKITKGQGTEPLQLTSAVYYHGIERGHEAILRKLRGSFSVEDN